MMSDVSSTSSSYWDSSRTILDLDESLALQDIQHAAHCLLHATHKCPFTGLKMFFAIMQVRSDGMIGFPGGFIEEEISKEGVLEGLKRELIEEMNVQVEVVPDIEGHVCSHMSDRESLVNHFFRKEITYEEVLVILKNFTTSQDFLTEVLGVFLVPIYWRELEDGTKFFPEDKNNDFWTTFMFYPFVGLAREQLLYSLSKIGVINRDFIRKFIDFDDEVSSNASHE